MPEFSMSFSAVYYDLEFYLQCALLAVRSLETRAIVVLLVCKLRHIQMQELHFAFSIIRALCSSSPSQTALFATKARHLLQINDFNEGILACIGVGQGSVASDSTSSVIESDRNRTEYQYEITFWANNLYREYQLILYSGY